MLLHSPQGLEVRTHVGRKNWLETAQQGLLPDSYWSRETSGPPQKLSKNSF